MKQKGAKTTDGEFVTKARDIFGTIALIGTALLAGMALMDLRPGWQWTQEDFAEQNSRNAGDEP